MRNIIGAIIPHAGEKYAGEARKPLFNYTTNIDIVIYIAALHLSSSLDSNVYIMENSNAILFKKFFEHNLTLKNNNRIPFIDIKNAPESVKKEHSFEWVKNELYKNIPNVNCLALCPGTHANLIYLVDKIYKFTEYKKDKNFLIIGTTDLIHYGKNYNIPENFLQKPYLYDKILKEQTLINVIKNTQVEKYIHNYKFFNYLLCGYRSVLVILYLAKKFKWKGQILDYYDSHSYMLSIKNKDPLQKYTIDFNYNYSQSFVSYVSIIYTNSITSKQLTDLDIKLALGILRSNITAELLNIETKILLPIWTYWYKMSNGIFVGTSLKTTNCSYGNYQSYVHNTNSANKIVKASRHCVNDARNRWQQPYIIKKINDYTYKIEILEDEKFWKTYNPKTIIDSKIIPNPKKGVYLELYNIGSATYLPVVAAENPEWTLDHYMGSLSKKAGGTYTDWKNSKNKIKIYTTKTYFWKANKNTFSID